MSQLEEGQPRALSPRARSVLLVFGVLVAHVLLSLRWSHANGWFARPTITEATPYRLSSAHFLRNLEEGGLLHWIASGYSTPDDHTPLLSMTGALVAWVMTQTITPTVMWLTMMLFASLLAVGTFRLARSFLEPVPAAAVMALTLAAPVVQGYQRDYLTSLPMVAMLIWALDALVRSDFFGVPRASGRFGLFAGLAAFAKVIAPLYLVGPALVALAVGLRRRGASTLRNVGLTALVFAMVLGPWLWFNLLRVLNYTDSVLDTLGVESTEEALSGTRWFYYPRAVINSGFGFAFGVLVVAALAWLGVSRTGREQWSLRGLVLGAVVLGSWGILTYGQTTSGSQYSFTWVPLGSLLLVYAITRLPGRAWRVGLSSAAALTLVWNLALAQRSVMNDRIVLRWNGWHVIGNTGQYMGTRLRRMRVSATPEAEPWPVREFTELVLDDAAPTVPIISRTHPLITGNMVYEAYLDGRVIERSHQPWSDAIVKARHAKVNPRFRRQRRTRWQDPLWPLTTIDYFVLDTSILNLDLIRELIESLDVTVETLATREVTEDSTVHLLALRKPWRRPAVEARDALAASTEKMEVEFANGWKLVGLEVVPRSEADASPVVHAFVEPHPDGTYARLLLEVSAGDGKHVWNASRVVQGVETGGLLAVCFDVLPINADRDLDYRLALEVHGRPGERHGILAADRPVADDAVTVRVPR